MKALRIHDLLLLLGAFIFSRTVFILIGDKEGPNLLIVTVLAIFIYGATKTLTRSWSVVTVQQVALLVLVEFLIAMVMLIALKTL